ncbi:MAG: hypothetical protein IPJ07_13230 [Acidobacteria bacterium]|nr:hypothetical protein [Acidobacteriota bacterium]
MCKIASQNNTELPDRLCPEYEIVVDRSIHQASNPFLTDPTAGFPDVSGIQLNSEGALFARRATRILNTFGEDARCLKSDTPAMAEQTATRPAGSTI